jgi:hypothetical protein
MRDLRGIMAQTPEGALNEPPGVCAVIPVSLLFSLLPGNSTLGDRFGGTASTTTKQSLISLRFIFVRNTPDISSG